MWAWYAETELHEIWYLSFRFKKRLTWYIMINNSFKFDSLIEMESLQLQDFSCRVDNMIYLVVQHTYGVFGRLHGGVLSKCELLSPMWWRQTRDINCAHRPFTCRDIHMFPLGSSLFVSKYGRRIVHDLLHLISRWN